MQRHRLPGERLADVRVGGLGVALEQFVGGDEQTRGAEAALDGAGVDERLLDRARAVRLPPGPCGPGGTPITSAGCGDQRCSPAAEAAPALLPLESWARCLA